MRAVVLIVGFAEPALQAGADLSANTNTVPNFDACHLVADFDSLANDFMAHADWKRALAPTASDGMDIRATDSAAFNLDVDITIFKLLGFELGIPSAICRSETVDITSAHFFLFEVRPLTLVLDHVALERIWVRHLG